MYLFSFDYPPLTGGIARLCSELANELLRRNALDTVLTSDLSPRLATANPEVRVSPTRPRSELAAFRFLATRRDREAVICGRWWPEASIALAARRGPVVVLAHGAELLDGVGAAAKLRQVVRRRVLETSQLVLANSRFTARLIEARAPRSRCVVLPLAVDANRFAPGNTAQARERLGLPLDTRVVTTVGRVLPNKGHSTVLHALARLEPDERRRCVYAIAGNGVHVPALKSLASQLGVEGEVRFLGHVSEEALPDVYRAADLHALLSEHTSVAVEGFGLASLEAQSTGVPALGTSAGGAADAIVDGTGGWLIPAGDVAATTEHLRALIHSPERYRAAGKVARERVLSECTWAHYGAALLKSVAGVASSR